jgi:hypothetical protein
VENQNGDNNQESFCLYLMEWMGRDLSTVKVESKDFYNFLTITAMNSKLPHLKNSSEMEIFKLFIVQLLLIISML